MSSGIQSQVARRIDEGKYHVAYQGARLAIQKNSYRYLSVFLKYINNVDASLEKGRTLLHFAAEKGCDLSVYALMRKGSNMHQLDDKGLSPYKLAREHFLLQKYMQFEQSYRRLV